MSRCFIVVARTHRGKSTWIKKRIKGKKNFILDIKSEYGAGFKKWHDPSDREGFLDHIIKTDMKNTCIVLEEASFYLSTRHYSSKAERVILNKWKSHNIFFLVYHSIRKIPDMVYEYADYMILFNTSDLIHHLKNKPEEILKGWEEVQKKSKKDKFYHKLIVLDDM